MQNILSHYPINRISDINERFSSFKILVHPLCLFTQFDFFMIMLPLPVQMILFLFGIFKGDPMCILLSYFNTFFFFNKNEPLITVQC